MNDEIQNRLKTHYTDGNYVTVNNCGDVLHTAAEDLATTLAENQELRDEIAKSNQWADTQARLLQQEHGEVKELKKRLEIMSNWREKSLEREANLRGKNQFLERCVTDKGKVIDELRDYLRWCYPVLSWLSAQPGYREKVKRIEDLLSD